MYVTECDFPYSVRGWLGRQGSERHRRPALINRMALSHTAWRRPTTPARSLPCDSCTLLPRATHPRSAESWT